MYACIYDHARTLKNLDDQARKSRGPETDGAGMHKRPENGMWLAKGGQIENGHIRISSLAHGKQRNKEWL